MKQKSKKKKRSVSFALFFGFWWEASENNLLLPITFPKHFPFLVLVSSCPLLSPPNSLFSVASLNLMEYFAECLLFNQAIVIHTGKIKSNALEVHVSGLFLGVPSVSPLLLKQHNALQRVQALEPERSGF